MLGFDLDIWDYLTFLTLMLCVVAVGALWLWLAGMPGRIALSRKHPEAEAVKLLGLLLVPDNAAGAYQRMEVLFNKNRFNGGVAGV